MATAGDGPVTKKQKKSMDVTDIFTTFYEDPRLLSLTKAIRTFDDDRSGYGLGILKIKVCNALSCKSFSNAVLETEELKVPGVEDVAYRYIPEAFDIRESVGSVLSCSKDETGLAATIAHHFLSKLAVSSTYTLDKGWSRDLHCGCGCTEKLIWEYGDTSMGVPSYWHGRVDILMEVPVTIITEESDSPGAGNSFFEKKTSSDRMIACKEQIRAESVVFSFLQKKKHPDLDNFLIPTIAMSKSQVAVCLYDSENDIYPETPLLDLFIGEYLKIETIITLWLVLNYRYCCSGVPNDILELGFTADFFKHTGPYLEKYVSEVTAPCSFQAANRWTALPVFKKNKEKKEDINDINQPSKESMN